MKKSLAILGILGLLAPFGTTASPSWQNTSPNLPASVLDAHVNLPYFSFSVSRGNDWLVGNTNQLFHVSADTVLDLTPDLQKFGFNNIRQVATDGSGWLIVGDISTWQTKPDIAMHYDGKYWKNVSTAIRLLPHDEWIGEITGKQGVWYFVTDKNIYLWHDALSEPAKITLPGAFKEPRTSSISIHPVQYGWMLNFEQKNGPKSIYAGRDVIDRRFFFFDGQNFQEQTSAFGNLSNYSTIGSNGANILVMGAVINAKTVDYKAYLSNGKNITDLSGHLKDLLPQNISPNSQYFLTQSKITWSGESWIFTNTSNKMAFWNQSHKPKFLPDAPFNILGVGYGKHGTVLISGYKNTEPPSPALTLFKP